MEKINIIAKKNKFITLKGQGKIKFLTKSKKYTADIISLKYSGPGIFSTNTYKVFCDSGYVFYYSKSELESLFIGINKSRDEKLNELGI